MTARTVIAWVVAAVLGLALAAGITLAASQLSSQRVGLSGQPLSAGDRLAPGRRTRRSPRSPRRLRSLRSPRSPRSPRSLRAETTEATQAATTEQGPPCRKTVVLRKTLHRVTDAGPRRRCHAGAMSGAHPVTLAIDYPERPLNRLTTAFRPFVAIPILILLGTVSGGSTDWTRGDTRTTVVTAGGLLFLGPLLMILFRGRYPGWWFDWNLNLLRFGTRVAAYIALLDDRYPSTEDEQAVVYGGTGR